MINVGTLERILNDLGENEIVLFYSNETELGLFNNEIHEYHFLGNLCHIHEVDLDIVSRDINSRCVIDISCITHYRIVHSELIS